MGGIDRSPVSCEKDFSRQVENLILAGTEVLRDKEGQGRLRVLSEKKEVE